MKDNERNISLFERSVQLIKRTTTRYKNLFFLLTFEKSFRNYYFSFVQQQLKRYHWKWTRRNATRQMFDLLWDDKPTLRFLQSLTFSILPPSFVLILFKTKILIHVP